MYNFVRVHHHQSVDNLPQNDPCLVLRDPLFFLDLSLQSLTIAVLDDQNLKILVLEYIIAFEEVGTIAHVHQLRLRLCESELNGFDDRFLLVFNQAHVYDFDCNLFFGIVVHASVDAAVRADSNQIVDYIIANAVVFDGFVTLFVDFVGEIKRLGY